MVPESWVDSVPAIYSLNTPIKDSYGGLWKKVGAISRAYGWDLICIWGNGGMVKKMEATIRIGRGLNKCRSRIEWNKIWTRALKVKWKLGSHRAYN